MAESLLPVLGAWWRSKGAREGAGASLPAGASTTPYDGSAIPVGGRRFTFEFTYSSSSDARVDFRVNWFSDSKVKVSGPFVLTSTALAAGQDVPMKVEVGLPDDPSPRWLPSIGVPATSGDVTFSALSVYETPAPAGPSATVWDGTQEVKVTVTVWDGTQEVPATLEIQD